MNSGVHHQRLDVVRAALEALTSDSVEEIKTQVRDLEHLVAALFSKQVPDLRDLFDDASRLSRPREQRIDKDLHALPVRHDLAIRNAHRREDAHRAAESVRQRAIAAAGFLQASLADRSGLDLVLPLAADLETVVATNRAGLQALELRTRLLVWRCWAQLVVHFATLVRNHAPWAPQEYASIHRATSDPADTLRRREHRDAAWNRRATKFIQELRQFVRLLPDLPQTDR